MQFRPCAHSIKPKPRHKDSRPRSASSRHEALDVKEGSCPPRHPPAPAGPVLPPASRQAAAFSQATFRVSSNCPLPVIKSFKLIGRFSTTSETTTSLPRAAKRLLTPLPFGSRGKEAKRRCRQQPMRNFASPGLGDAQHPN